MSPESRCSGRWVAGFANNKTPEKDWIAEIRGVQGIEKILPTDIKLGQNAGEIYSQITYMPDLAPLLSDLRATEYL